MIKAKLLFSTTEAIQLFKNAGLEVQLVDWTIWFSHPKHPDGGTDEIVSIMSVINPHTGKPEKLEEAFNRFLEHRKAELFLTAEKLEIYNLFER